MMERYRPTTAEAQIKEPVDVKAVKIGKIIDKFQIGIGGGAVIAGALFAPALIVPGLILGGMGVGEHYIKSMYIDWRTKNGHQQTLKSQDSKVTLFRQKRALSQAA